jgi:hypothetical protein
MFAFSDNTGMLGVMVLLLLGSAAGKHKQLTRFPQGLFGVADQAAAPQRKTSGGCAAV